MITKVQCFQTADGKTFIDQSKAAAHAFRLTLRGIVQADEKNVTNYSASQVADILASKIDNLSKAITDHRRTMGRLNKKVGVLPSTV